jgi:hypothetical protein
MERSNSFEKLKGGKWYAESEDKQKHFFLYKNKWVILENGIDAKICDHIPTFKYVLQPFCYGRIQDLAVNFKYNRIHLKGVVFYYFNDDEIYSNFFINSKMLPCKEKDPGRFLSCMFYYFYDFLLDFSKEEEVYFRGKKLI